MNIAIRASFWTLTFGGLGYILLKVAKPDDELVKQIATDYKHTDTTKFAKDSIGVIKQAIDQNSEISKKVDEMLKGKK